MQGKKLLLIKELKTDSVLGYYLTGAGEALVVTDDQFEKLKADSYDQTANYMGKTSWY